MFPPCATTEGDEQAPSWCTACQTQLWEPAETFVACHRDEYCEDCYGEHVTACFTCHAREREEGWPHV